MCLFMSCACTCEDSDSRNTSWVESAVTRRPRMVGCTCIFLGVILIFSFLCVNFVRFLFMFMFCYVVFLSNAAMCDIIWLSS